MPFKSDAYSYICTYLHLPSRKQQTGASSGMVGHLELKKRVAGIVKLREMETVVRKEGRAEIAVGKAVTMEIEMVVEAGA